jgi:hypothetical protein
LVAVVHTGLYSEAKAVSPKSTVAQELISASRRHSRSFESSFGIRESVGSQASGRMISSKSLIGDASETLEWSTPQRLVNVSFLATGSNKDVVLMTGRH